MKDMEIQTDTLPPPVQVTEEKKESESDLIRLQSSMSLMQEDHLKERKLLNERIAQLQQQIQNSNVIEETKLKKELIQPTHNN